MSARRYIQEITSVTVDTVLTPLLANTRLGDVYDALLFAVINDSLVNPVTVTVQTGEDSTAVDAQAVFTFDVPVKVGSVPGQNSLLLAPPLLRTYWRVSAQASGGQASVRWLLKGEPKPERGHRT